MKSITRRVVAGAAALTVAFGAVACSEADEAANKAGDAASSATSAAGDAAGGAKDKAKEATESAKASESAGKEGATEEVATADGKTTLVPADLATAIANEEGNWGKPETIQEGEKGFLATYANGDQIVYADAIGAVPVVGKINETWMSEGGLDAEIGLPTAPENVIENGWDQSFQNGTIVWTNDGQGGEYSADIQKK
ncbi:LGFP repeat-containing protein [Corynebacterium tapiri]|uniref:Esterase n=1 Tax=Corynebacterium tapiri TaxID=1448266 RepID=A0A5C4U6H7_9CORY|nr:hypothetical protein [Corynebacterium tapiri]TNM00502.1 hypothetical protein FHE74_00710 [Corynebacterium tapiri]